MRPAALALIALGTWRASAQQPTSKSDAQVASARLRETVAREDARQNAGFCLKDGSTAGLNGCFRAEMEKSKANYLEAVRSLGALLRASDDKANAGPPQRLPFDDAEETWTRYQKQTCDVVYKTWEGGTGGGPAYGACIVSTYGTHIHELGVVYAVALQ